MKESHNIIPIKLNMDIIFFVFFLLNGYFSSPLYLITIACVLVHLFIKILLCDFIV